MTYTMFNLANIDIRLLGRANLHIKLGPLPRFGRKQQILTKQHTLYCCYSLHFWNNSTTVSIAPSLVGTLSVMCGDRSHLCNARVLNLSDFWQKHLPEHCTDFSLMYTVMSKDSATGFSGSWPETMSTPMQSESWTTPAIPQKARARKTLRSLSRFFSSDID
jgi:hypothetical protein